MQEREDAIALDFDGVVHSYHSGWTGIEPKDGPVPGAREAIARLRERFRIIVHSFRTTECGGREAIEDWLCEHEIVVDEIASEKPKAILYVDDRGFRFEGDWAEVEEHLSDGKDGVEPWNRDGSESKPQSTLIVLIGFPASGKSTHAQHILKTMPSALRVSSDDLIAMTGQDYSPRRQEIIRGSERRFVRDAIFDGFTVVVDRTNLSRRERASWIELGKELDTPVVAVHVQSLEWKIRNAKRPEATLVPDEAIHRMENRFEEPTIEEGFREIRVVRT